MTLKDFDIKQFMLKHGEWVGLAVAAAIMLPAFVIGAMNIFTSGSARANAEDINKLANAADTKIDQSIPPADADKAPVEGTLEVRLDRVEPKEYRPPGEWFIPSSFEDNKRRAPVVWAAGDFQTTLLRGGMLGHVFIEADGHLKTMVILERHRDPSPREKRMIERYKKWLKEHGGSGGLPGMGMPGMSMPGMGGGAGGMGAGGKMGGMGMGGGTERGGQGGGMPGMGGLPGMGLPGNRPGGASTNMEKKAKLMDVDKIANEQNVHFADRLYPVRMAIVTGAFPFKDQLESFRIALRKRNLNELMSILDTPDAPWQFDGLEIDRRVLHLDGREKFPWQRYDDKMRAALKLYLARAKDAEKEDPELSKFWGLKNRGLIWPRPVLALPYKANDEESRYPKVEISSLKEAITKLEKEGTENVAKAPNRLKNRIKGNFDFDNPDDPLGDEDENKMDQQPDAATKPPEGEPKPKTGEDEPVVPDKALVRFMDMTVEPGYAYEYRVRVRMVNPNYKKEKEVAYPALAKNKTIVGDNSQPIRVEVPWEVDWYITDDRPTERLTLQIQKWLDVTAPEPNMDQNLKEVADWSIADRTPAARGEYVGRPELVQIPTWDTEKEDWELARNPKRSGTRFLVDFTVRTNQQFPALLIDYDGGKAREVRLDGKMVGNDEAPVRALVLTPEGKLEIRSNLEDKENPERKKRYDEWKSRLEDVRNPNKRKKDLQPNLFDRNKGPAQ